MNTFNHPIQMIVLNAFKLGRLVAVFLLAAFVTSILLLFMYNLVVNEFVAPEEKPLPTIPDIVWDMPKPMVIRSTSKPSRKNEPVPPIIPNLTTDPVKGGIVIPPVTNGVIGTREKIDFSFGAGETPIARILVAPRYPGGAIARRIEGYVDVRFDVTAQGSTKNLQIIHAAPENIFNKAALKAVEKWRFDPKTIDGKPVAYIGMLKRVRFELNK